MKEDQKFKTSLGFMAFKKKNQRPNKSKTEKGSSEDLKCWSYKPTTRGYSILDTAVSRKFWGQLSVEYVHRERSKKNLDSETG